MERDFYNEDIEQLLKQKADQYKMYPSDKVWKGINRSLHPRRKWYWFSFLLFLGALSYYTIMDLIAPPGNGSLAESKNPVSQSPTNTDSEKQAVVIPFVNTQQKTKGPAVTKKNNNIAARQQATTTEITLAPTEGYTFDNSTVESFRQAPVYDLRRGKLKEDILDAVPAEKIVRDEGTASTEIKNIVEPAAEPSAGVNFNAANKVAENEDSKRINWLQENAVYEMAMPRPERWSWQFSFSPTMSYRKLAGSRHARIHSDAKNIPIALNIEGDPDNLVNAKPALGLELGSHVRYTLSKSFAVRAGIQFNYSRYDIQAYTNYTTERATIALNRNSGVIGDSLTSYTHLRNFGGDAVQELRNQYFQISVPIGLEMRLVGNNKLQIGVAGTVQPTYLLNRNTYLITTDYKNYTQEPTLLRRWNLNTSAEAFIAYKTGDLKWQVGPQFRYQLLSSYIKEYPLTEHLMEFGIKIGVAKTIR